MSLRTSEQLFVGAVYSRKALAEKYSITDATINTGIFQPAGHASVWLFVTRDKTSDRTQYVDRLEGDALYFEGQMAGRTDQLIREHRAHGVEILLFFRERKDEYADYGFRYEGEFEYVSSTAGKPTRFHLRRVRDRSGAIHFFALVCNPTRFAGLEAAQVLPELAWTVDRMNPQVGDRVALWQAKGKGDRRGIVAIGEVTRGVVSEPCPEPEMRFWRQQQDGIQPRIRFRVFAAPGLPLWEDEGHAWLGGLAAARATGGTVFTLQPEQWARIEELASAGGDREDPKVGTGQGIGLTAAERRAVEHHAQAIAEAHFKEAGYVVVDVSRNGPFDLLCKRGDGELHVEVKGTTGNGDDIFLTRNEVAHARENSPKMALLIVSHILLERTDNGPQARGGTPRVWCPWDIDRGEMSPIQYRYTPPPRSM